MTDLLKRVRDGELVGRLQEAVNGLQVPTHITPAKAEYWKAGAVAAIKVMNAAIAAAPDHSDELLRALEGSAEPCRWHQEDECGECFNSECGHSYMINDVETDGMKFCLFCGHPVEFVMWKDDDAMATQPEDECCDVCHEPLADGCPCQNEYNREHDTYADR